MQHAITSKDRSKLRKINHYIYNLIAMARWFTSDCYSLPQINCFTSFLAATDSTVISFNYDTLIEESLGLQAISSLVEKNGLLPSDKSKCPAIMNWILPENLLHNWIEIDNDGYLDYGAGWLPARHKNTDGVKVLKLHGSAGWYYCSKCLETFYLPHSTSTSAGLILDEPIEDCYFCKKCGAEKTLMSLFVPPASDSEFPTWELLDFIWRSAEDELLSSDLIIIAGYSLPPEDIRAYKLLKRIFSKKNIKLLIVNPYIENSTHDRITSISPNTLFFKGTFTEFLREIALHRSGLHNNEDSSTISNLEITKDLSSKGFSRTPSSLYGSPSWDKSISEQLNSESLSEFTKSVAIAQLGIVGSKKAVEFIIDFSKSSGKSLLGVCVKSICSGDNQLCLEYIEDYFKKPQIMTYEKIFVAGKGGIFERKVSIAMYVISGLQNLFFRRVKLDYIILFPAFIMLLKDDSIDSLVRNQAINTMKVGLGLNIFSKEAEHILYQIMQVEKT